MISHRASFSASVLLAFFTVCASALLASPAHAACSDKKVMSMSAQGKSVSAIAKACNQPAAKVRALIESDGGKGDEAAKSVAKSPPAAAVKSEPKPAATVSPKAAGKTADKASAADPDPLLPRKLPSGAGLVSCDCQGTVPYGDKAPELRCQSGMSIATPCAGYCPPRGVAPWRRVCS